MDGYGHVYVSTTSYVVLLTVIYAEQEKLHMGQYQNINDCRSMLENFFLSRSRKTIGMAGCTMTNG